MSAKDSRTFEHGNWLPALSTLVILWGYSQNFLQSSLDGSKFGCINYEKLEKS
jgi:hypothetical protein